MFFFLKDQKYTAQAINQGKTTGEIIGITTQKPAVT
jgi:hypothetical protein